MPDAWYIHISPAPSERRLVKCLRATMLCPSRVHVGWLRRRKLSLVTWRGWEPSTFITQILSPPLPPSPVRSETKAICVPSGLKAGCMSHAGPPATHEASPPAKGIV